MSMSASEERRSPITLTLLTLLRTPPILLTEAGPRWRWSETVKESCWQNSGPGLRSHFDKMKPRLGPPSAATSNSLSPFPLSSSPLSLSLSPLFPSVFLSTGAGKISRFLIYLSTHYDSRSHLSPAEDFPEEEIPKTALIWSLLCPQVLRNCLTGLLLRLHNPLYIQLEVEEWFTLRINFSSLSTLFLR